MPSVQEPARAIPEISALDLFARLGDERPPLVLDVREPEEAAQELGYLEGSHLIPLRSLAERVGELADRRGEEIVVICAVGGRSAIATRFLVEHGFERVANLTGGLLAWHDEGLPFLRATEGEEQARCDLGAPSPRGPQGDRPTSDDPASAA